jgi:hypothetical protein
MYSFESPLQVGEFDHCLARQYATDFLENFSIDEQPGSSGRYRLSSLHVARLVHASDLSITRPILQDSFNVFVHTMRQQASNHLSTKWHQDPNEYGYPAELISGFTSNPTNVLMGNIDFYEVLNKLQREAMPPLVSLALKHLSDDCSAIIDQALENGDATIIGPPDSTVELEPGVLYDMTGSIHCMNTDVCEYELDMPRAFLYAYDRSYDRA